MLISDMSGLISAVHIYIYIKMWGRQPTHNFQIWVPQPFALGCAGWSPVGPSPHEGNAADDA